MLAMLGCTLGLFNISRFAILSIHFGGNHSVVHKQPDACIDVSG
jgi:SNF family Na+-dependent transporter